MVINYLKKKSNQNISPAPLSVLRIAFGVLMLFGIVRFWSNGWINDFYIEPTFFFSYFGFEWVKPIGIYTYLIFIICGLSCVGIILGYKYRLSIILFFLSFTYIELMDKTLYLNHYYFISALSFLLIFLPLNSFFSLDSYRNRDKYPSKVPLWTLNSVKILISIVYFYAGLAKINSEWILDATPLDIWLSSKENIPIIGQLFKWRWSYYIFSWSSVVYDLSIPFLLFYKRTRFVAFLLVVVFHVLTSILFPIGMFPYIMITMALVFFDVSFHKKIIQIISKLLKINVLYGNSNVVKTPVGIYAVIVVFFLFQLLFPWRYLLYPGELFWNEEGYRFSWRVMLMEKMGYAQFKIVEPELGNIFYVDNMEFLTPLQERQMAMQPDFILEYAHFLGDFYRKKDVTKVEVYVESFAALNGRMHRPYIDPNVNLLDFKRGFSHKTFILTFNDTIYGF